MGQDPIYESGNYVNVLALEAQAGPVFWPECWYDVFGN